MAFFTNEDITKAREIDLQKKWKKPLLIQDEIVSIMIT